MAKDESTGQQLIALHVWHTNLVRCLARRLPRKARYAATSAMFCSALLAVLLLPANGDAMQPAHACRARFCLYQTLARFSQPKFESGLCSKC